MCKLQNLTYMWNLQKQNLQTQQTDLWFPEVGRQMDEMGEGGQKDKLPVIKQVSPGM